MSSIGAAIIVAGVIAGGASIYSSKKQRGAMKNAEDEARAANDRALAEAQAAKETAASQAGAQIKQKRRKVSQSSSIYTSPLGVTEQAATAKKTLLGQ